MIKFRMEFIFQRLGQLELLAAVITVRNSLPMPGRLLLREFWPTGRETTTG
jgi:hypothetical protein